jgi:hypothetical protein
MTNTDAPRDANEQFNFISIYLPRIQNIAEPALTMINNGMQRQSTATY